MEDVDGESYERCRLSGQYIENRQARKDADRASHKKYRQSKS